MMASGSRDLQCHPSLVLAQDVGEVRPARLGRPLCGWLGDRLRTLPTSDPPITLDELGEMGDRMHPGTGDEPRLGRVTDGDDHVAPTGPYRGEHDRQHPWHGPYGRVQTELPDVDDVTDHVDRDLAGRREHRHGDAEVESAADLAFRRR